MSKSVWIKAWSILEAREKAIAGIVLVIVVLAALSSAVMIASIIPFLTVLASPSEIQDNVLYRKVYEIGNFGSEYSFLVFLGAVSLFIITAANLVQILKSWAVARFSFMRVNTISCRLLEKYLHKPYEYFFGKNTGKMTTLILSESQEAVTRFYRPAADIIAAFFTVLAIVSVLLLVNAVVTGISFFVLGGIYALVVINTRRMIARRGKQRAMANQLRFKIASESLTGIKGVKIAGQESAYAEQFRAPSLEMANSIISAQVLAEVPQYVIQIVGFGGVIILCLLLLSEEHFGAQSAISEMIPLIGVFAFAGQRMLPELSKLYRGVTQLNYGAAAVELIFRELADSSTSSKPVESGSLVTPVVGGDLRLENVSYTYPGSASAGIFEVSLSIKCGEKIGIVGGSGAGKTTLADCLLGLLRPQSGQLFVGDAVLSDRNIRQWQKRVGYVPQDIFLSDGTVMQNIALGQRPEAIDIANAKRAAAVAMIDEFIEKELPEGYSTKIGENGVQLSGGQRQRIGIARALYRQADTIIFDEATSALDNVIEHDVMLSIDNIPGDKTIIIIAHRLSTVRDCDKIVMMSRGHLLGFGTWDELYDTCSEFRVLVSGEDDQ